MAWGTEKKYDRGKDMNGQIYVVSRTLLESIHELVGIMQNWKTWASKRMKPSRVWKKLNSQMEERLTPMPWKMKMKLLNVVVGAHEI